MSSERKQILDMLANGTINSDEAERLLDAINQNAEQIETGSQPTGKKPKFLYVKVNGEPGTKHENVDIKIPIMLLKAGLKLGSIVPSAAKAKFTTHLGDHGIDLDLNKLDSEKIDTLVQALTENSIDIDTGGERVKIYCA